VAQAQALVLQPLCSPSQQPEYGREKDSTGLLSEEAESPNSNCTWNSLSWKCQMVPLPKISKAVLCETLCLTESRK